MTIQVRGAEEFFLRLVKYAILAMMGLALVAIPIMLIIGGVNLTSQPKEPEPAKTAPVKEVTMDGLQAYLMELQKRQDAAENFDPSKKKATEQDAPPAQYLVNAVDIFRCLQKFAVAAEISFPVNYDSNDAAMRYRGEIESQANKPGRGDPYVNSLNSFICKVLADPAVIALKKEKTFKGGMLTAVTIYHRDAWDRIVNERNRFEAAEQSRVHKEREAESSRVEADRTRAKFAFTGVGAAFAIFMLLAIYLILAKIETNMREINDSIRTHRA